MNYPIKVLVLDTVMDRGGAESMIMNYLRNIDRSKIQMGRYREQSDIRLGSSRNEGIHQIG